MEEWKTRYGALEERYDETEKLLQSEQSKTASEADVSRDQVSQLQATIDGLREELATQDAEAQATVSQWMSSYDELKAQYTALQQHPGQTSDAEQQKEITELRKKLEEETSAADEAIAQWQASYNGLKEQYDAIQNQAAAEGGASDLTSENEALKKQIEEQKRQQAMYDMTSVERSINKAVSAFQVSFFSVAVC